MKRRTQILAGILAMALVASLTAGATAQSPERFTFPASGFTDVPAGAFYERPVNWAVDQGITVGISPTEFGPNLSLPRSQGLTFIWRAYGSPTGNPPSGFTDVPAGSFYEEAVNWAKAKGITTGISPTLFGPDVIMTRAMFVTLLHRAAGEPNGDVVREWNVDGTAAPGTEVVGSTDLTRSASGLEATLHVEGLTPGGVYTFWLVAIHADPFTIPDDVFVAHGAGAIVGEDGEATVDMKADTGQKGIVGFPPLEGALWHDLTDPVNSLVRIEIAYHGQEEDAGEDLETWLSDFWTGKACPPDTPNPNPEQPHCPVYYAATHTASGFTDVPPGSFFEKAVNWAKENGITVGITPTMFGPHLEITRAEAVTMMFREPEQLQILAINDFHGNLDRDSGSFGGTGGIDFLAANMRAREADAKNSITVSAGDLIGASPLISGLFHDEPTIEAMNLLGLDINGVGNHEFDEGSLELLRMANGGTHPVDGDFGGTVFEGADFDFLAANVRVKATGETLFAPYTVRNFGGVDVAFIGMTLEGTPTIVTQAGVEGLTFHDEIETVNALVPMLQAKDIEAIVVLLHEGGFSNGGAEGDECMGGLEGPLADIVDGFDPAVDLVVAGHVNDEFVCEHNGMWVTMADGTGRLFTDIDVTLSRQTYDMTVTAVDNVPNNNDPAEVTPAADLTALRDLYDELSAPLANRVIGTITADITEAETAAGESALGDVIADAQLASTEGVGVGEAVVAFMNPGGIRDDLLFAASGEEADGEVTFGEAFSVQPFGNSLITMTLTGAQIDALLEQQFDNPEPGRNRILQVSDGFTYTWDSTAAVGSRVDPSTIKIGGVTVVPGDPYRVTVNSFLADGGDNFSVLRDGTDRLGGEIDLDALDDYFGANSPVPPGPQDRITVIT